jgi:hypothetical protein
MLLRIHPEVLIRKLFTFLRITAYNYTNQIDIIRSMVVILIPILFVAGIISTVKYKKQ